MVAMMVPRKSTLNFQHKDLIAHYVWWKLTPSLPGMKAIVVKCKGKQTFGLTLVYCTTYQTSIQIHGNKEMLCMLLVQEQKHPCIYIQVLATKTEKWSQTTYHTDWSTTKISDRVIQIRNALHRHHLFFYAIKNTKKNRQIWLYTIFTVYIFFLGGNNSRIWFFTGADQQRH